MEEKDRIFRIWLQLYFMEFMPGTGGLRRRGGRPDSADLKPAECCARIRLYYYSAGKRAALYDGEDQCMKIGTTELLIILAIIILVFGPSQIPKLAKMFKKSTREFKKGMEEAEKEDDDTSEE